MNLNQTELDVIRDVVRAAVAEAMKSLRDELKADLDKSYSREVIDLKLNEMSGKIDDLTEKVGANSNTLKNLWDSAFGKVIVIANGILVLYALSQILPR